MGVKGQSRARTYRTGRDSELGQEPGVDCGCTYAPVCRIQSIRMALTIVVHEDCDILQLDLDSVSRRKRPRTGIPQDPSWLRVSRRCYRTTSLHETQKESLRTPPGVLATGSMPSTIRLRAWAHERLPHVSTPSVPATRPAY